MTRIIGGIAGSLRLVSPAKATRPTSDRIRESIFSRLESRNVIQGCSVLDLYAGTGALGLEAASRGASAVMLVERDGKAAAVCKQNAQLVEKVLIKNDAEVKIRVSHQACSAFLAASSASYDLVFIDPPYEVPNADIESHLAELAKSLKSGATIVVERSSRSEKLAGSADFDLEEIKNYGDTDIYWFEKN